MRKSQFNFMDPKVMMTVVVSLMVLLVGVFAFFTVWGNLSEEEVIESVTDKTKSQSVTDPSIQQTMTLPAGVTIESVTERYNDGTSSSIDSGNWSYSGTTITVNVTG